MGDDLKFIDFHQLQIENKVYVKEIDEKNKKLLMLKIATGILLYYFDFRQNHGQADQRTQTLTKRAVTQRNAGTRDRRASQSDHQNQGIDCGVPEREGKGAR